MPRLTMPPELTQGGQASGGICRCSTPPATCPLRKGRPAAIHLVIRFLRAIDSADQTPQFPPAAARLSRHAAAFGPTNSPHVRLSLTFRLPPPDWLSSTLLPVDVVLRACDCRHRRSSNKSKHAREQRASLPRVSRCTGDRSYTAANTLRAARGHGCENSAVPTGGCQQQSCRCCGFTRGHATDCTKGRRRSFYRNTGTGPGRNCRTDR